MISVLVPTIRPEGLLPIMECLEKQTYQDFEVLVELGQPWKGCDLSASMNRMVARAKGDIVVIYQDYIYIPNDALEKIVENHRLSPGTAFTYPVSKIDKVGDEPKHDWRIHSSGFVDYYKWETDFASAPKELFAKTGGYDEDFDKGWSWENVNLAHRASKQGFLFRCSTNVKALAIDHDKFSVHPFRGKNENQELSKLKSLEIETTGL